MLQLLDTHGGQVSDECSRSWPRSLAEPEIIAVYLFLAVLLTWRYPMHLLRWHLGQNVMKAIPIGRGFDTYLGYWSGAEEYYTHDTKGSYDFNDDIAPSHLRPAVNFNSECNPCLRSR